MNFYKTIYSFIALYRSRTSNLILALLCFLLFALDSHAQTNDAIGRISDVFKYDRVDIDSGSSIAQNNRTGFSSSIANLGDIDGNGTDDLAVGGSNLSIRIESPLSLNPQAGAVYILLMNGDTIETIRRITHVAGTDFGISNSRFFGVSVANIGDFDDDDEINELAVGAIGIGAIYILQLNSNGQLQSDGHSRIDFDDINTILGNDDLVEADRFGVSIANMGDIDGDGVNDLAVGAHRDDDTGSVHILFMNEAGTGLKAAAKIDSTHASLLSGDAFGISVANLGDLDQDGINDLAVGASDDDGVADNAGTVHIFHLNKDGSVKPDSFEIFDSTFDLGSGNNAGRSIANLGDLNRDGINDIVVGSPGDNTAFTIFMRRAGDNPITTNGFFRINTTSHADLDLADDDLFGISIANIRDRNGDGVNDLAVGAQGTSGPGSVGTTVNFEGAGAFYILYMDAETTVQNIMTVADGMHETSDEIDIQIMFSEVVDVNTAEGRPILTLETGDNDTTAVYTSGSGSDTLTFRYIVAANDRAADLDYKDTTSLTLNGGTITASAAPSRAAILTLPKPGTRGSISAQKNISINMAAFTNTPPSVVPTPIEPQELTVNILFTYTIIVTDRENDPLTYNVPALPDWLTFDADTGIFSGRPVDKQDRTEYDFTVSDGTVTTTFTLTITVNAAPTLPMIADITYVPGMVPIRILPEVISETGTSPIEYSLSPELPDGLTFSTETRAISGTAPNTELTEQQYTYTAEDANGALAVQTFTITIERILRLPNILNKVYIIGNEVNQMLPKATGGTTPIDYSLSPELPEGLTFNSDREIREISGTPTAVVVTEYAYTATDALGVITTTSFTVISAAETNEAIGYGGVSHFVINDRDNLRFTIDNGTQEITLDDARAPAPGFTDSDTEFGSSVANLGDINGDGIDDLAVGARLDDTDDVFDAGAVYILLMNRTER